MIRFAAIITAVVLGLVVVGGGVLLIIDIPAPVQSIEQRLEAPQPREIK